MEGTGVESIAKQVCKSVVYLDSCALSNDSLNIWEIASNSPYHRIMNSTHDSIREKVQA